MDKSEQERNMQTAIEFSEKEQEKIFSLLMQEADSGESDSDFDSEFNYLTSQTTSIQASMVDQSKQIEQS